MNLYDRKCLCQLAAPVSLGIGATHDIILPDLHAYKRITVLGYTSVDMVNDIYESNDGVTWRLVLAADSMGGATVYELDYTMLTNLVKMVITCGAAPGWLAEFGVYGQEG
jgi:hypothetical protein